MQQKHHMKSNILSRANRFRKLKEASRLLSVSSGQVSADNHNWAESMPLTIAAGQPEPFKTFKSNCDLVSVVFLFIYRNY